MRFYHWLLFVLLCSTVGASTLEFSVYLEGQERDFDFIYYDHGGVEVPIPDFFFHSFDAHLIGMELMANPYFVSGPEGEYVFLAQLIDDDGKVLEERKVGVDFFILDGADDLNETVIFVNFGCTTDAAAFRLYYGSSLLVEQHFEVAGCDEAQRGPLLSLRDLLLSWLNRYTFVDGDIVDVLNLISFYLE